MTTVSIIAARVRGVSLENRLITTLLTATALLYCWGLDKNGWANSYYSAAAMAGAQDWTAFLFGSSDPANAISVDKPPLSLWAMSLAVRIFGLNSWSLLLPQALFGVLSVYLLFKTVRAYTDSLTAFTAGVLFALTPVATVMFRYNNPDAMLCLLMIGVAHATLKSIRERKVAWLILAGGLVGAGFLTKQLQIVLIIPAIIITYLGFANSNFKRKVLNLCMAGLTAVIAGGWWLLILQFTDPGSRPYVGGSMTNSAAELTLGYNGIERLTGQDAATSSSSSDLATLATLAPGFQRFLQPGFTGQFGWFLPLAAAGSLIVLMQFHQRRGRLQGQSLAVLSIVWFVVSVSLIAFMSGIVHPYYGLSAVPPMCSLAAIALVSFLRSTATWRWRLLLTITLLASAMMAYVSAARSTDDFPGLPQILLGLWAVTIALGALPLPHRHLRRIFALLLVFAVLLGPTAWSLYTVSTGHIGAAVSAGPSTLGIRADDPGRQHLNKKDPPSVTAAMLGDMPVAAVTQQLRSSPSEITWPGAIVGSESAANYQLETGRPILAIGGFNGSDPFPTLEQFIALVEEQKIGAMVIQTLPPVPAEGRGEAARIVAWVRANHTAQVFGGAELYKLAP
ncbi:glycosyl transferase [Arthrobacter sp. RT-1]|uniref:glycosyltransferase family 39 protein n=1 Tax=Arthrobacter sp. RT-1 TaxID=2292263 RepID=UPI000E1F8D78|nr:glycosyltransferase family 39 protein [Arthrobacter sp. RT-1]RDV09722.1 glycosyl transferase [Arthrobacter sp. RT-1]